MIVKKLFIDGAWVDTGTAMDVIDKFSGDVIARVATANVEQTKTAIDAAYRAKKAMAKLTARQRGDILDNVSRLLLRDKEEIARIITAEGGKGILFSRGEVVRSAETFQFAADEARRLGGELIPFDASATGSNRFGYYKRYPVGVVGAITPFNFPLNLVAHKVGPAIAAGNALVLKPASTTPLTSVKLVELLLEAGLPAEGINLVVGGGGVVGETMVISDKIDMITFTGSPGVGLELKKKAGMKKVTLELGNNSAVIIHEDADVAKAMPRCVIGAFSNSGQVCISIQRIYIHESKYAAFRDMFVDAVKKSQNGDPMDEKTLVGPMIEEREAVRSHEWIQEAVAQGATLLVGGNRTGRLLEATVLENVTEEMTVVREEVFAPIVSLMPYKTIDEVLARVNDSIYGLQAGIYTNDINTAFRAIDELHVGGVMVNDMPTFRVDNMPYGGVKLSGTGREGAKYSVEEMTELKTVMFNFN